MFWTSKDKPSASDTVTQSCSLWQRWVSERNIGCSSQCGVNLFLSRFLWSWLSRARLPAWLLYRGSRARTIPHWTSTTSRTPASPVEEESMEGETRRASHQNCLLIFNSRFYSDEEAFCQMYHMCVAESTGSFKKFSFLCPNGQSTLHSPVLT